MKDGRVVFFNRYEKIVTRPDVFLSSPVDLVVMCWQRLRVKEKILLVSGGDDEEEEEGSRRGRSVNNNRRSYHQEFRVCGPVWYTHLTLITIILVILLRSSNTHFYITI